MTKFILLLPLIFGVFFAGHSAVIKRIDINQGLSNNYCQGIVQDRQGFIWIGTESGLNRFDGHEFKTFYYSDIDLNSLNSNELNDIYADKKNDIIWAGTERDGLNCYHYDTHQFSRFRHDANNIHSLSSNAVMSLSGESKGNVWVSTYSTGVDLLDTKSLTFTHYNRSTVKGLKSNFVRCAIEDHQGNLYIGHLQDGLSIVSLKNKMAINFTPDPKNPQSIPSTQVLSLLIDSKKRIWVGTDNGLALFNSQTKTFTIFRRNSNPGSLQSNFITAIHEVNNELWIGSVDGLDILKEQYGITESPEKVVFQHVKASDNADGLSHPNVNCILQDRYKNVWIGAYGGGINFVSSKSAFFHTTTHSNSSVSNTGLSNKIVLSTCFSSQNELWVGTDGSGIDVFRNGIKIRNYCVENHTLTDNRVTALYEDTKGNIWIGDASGTVLCYNSRSRQFKTIEGFALPIYLIRGFVEDNYQTLWITAESGIYSLNLITGEQRYFNNQNSKLGFPITRASAIDNQGRIWIGLLSGGVQIFTHDFKLIRSFPSTDNLYSVNHILCDKKGRMWVSSRQGLSLFKSCDDTSYTTYGMKDGLPSNHIRAVAEDTNGKMWISTNAGLSCLNTKTGRIQNFNQKDGVPVGNFMSAAVAKSTDGTIYFGSENGLCYFNSNESLPSFDLPDVTITNISIIDKKNAHTGDFTDIPISKKIHLEYNQSTINLKFNILDYSLSNMVEFSYQMKGLDDSWYNLQYDKSLIFRNLRPGKYIFSIKARLRNQEWSDKVTTLEIVIRPPFWFSWWAETIYLAIILLITLYIVRFYKNKVNLENSLMYEKRTHQQEQELNEERLRFYTNITHELRTPLTLIIGPLEDLAQDQNLEHQTSKKINSIYRSANRLLELINQILEFRKSETNHRSLSITHGDIGHLVMETGLKFKELNQNKEVTLNIVVPHEPKLIYYDAEVMTIILDNLLSNAFKYTPKGNIQLELRHVMDGKTPLTEIVVSDSGYGISADALPRIFDHYYQAKDKHQMAGTGIGLSLVKNMVDLHQASIRVDSILGKGTVFSLRLLSDNKYPDAVHAQLMEESAEIEEEFIQNNHQLMLVVEDNEDIRNYICDCFTDSFEVLTAEDGKKGLELAIERTPDVIISDIMMPVMDGITFCRKLKEEVKTSHIPVILLTAKDSIQDKTEGYNTGADSYITKPFSARLLQSRVSNLLEARRKMNLLFSSSDTSKKMMLSESLNRLDNEFIAKVKAIIEENIESEQISMAQIAQRLNMSHSTLYRKLKAVTGLSINEFVRKTKLQTAEELMLTGKYTISQISFMIGIGDPRYFSRCFKEEFGSTPKEYLQIILNEKG